MAVTPLHQDMFHLPAVDASVSVARGRVRDRLHEWRVAEEVADDAQLLVSELFTNAVRHTTSDKVSCAVLLEGGRLRLEVADEGGGMGTPIPVLPPTDASADMDGECGRGLLLVGALADSWGVQPRGLTEPDGSASGGYVVWAELASGTPGP